MRDLSRLSVLVLLSAIDVSLQCERTFWWASGSFFDRGPTLRGGNGLLVRSWQRKQILSFSNVNAPVSPRCFYLAWQPTDTSKRPLTRSTRFRLNCKSLLKPHPTRNALTFVRGSNACEHTYLSWCTVVSDEASGTRAGIRRQRFDPRSSRVSDPSGDENFRPPSE